MNLDRNNKGYIFETIIYEKLKELDFFDEILYEDDLRKRWGFDAVGVDYLLIYRDHVIMLQAKWRKTRRRENNHIGNFLKSIRYIQNILGEKTMVFGLWVSRVKPFTDNVEHLQSNNILCVSDFDSMTEVADRMMDIIQTYRHHVLL